MTHTPTLHAIADHGAFVRRLAHGLLRDAATAEDLVQDTWLSFLRRPPQNALRTKSWLASVVLNRARSGHRDAKHRAEREAVVARQESIEPASTSAERLELQQTVVAAVLALPEHYRKVVLLVYYEGLSTGETARRLGLPAGTVRSQLSRGLAELRGALDRDYPGGRAAWSLAVVGLMRRAEAVVSAAKAATVLALVGGGGAAAWLVSDSAHPAATNTLAASAATVAEPAPASTLRATGLPRMTRTPVLDAAAGATKDATQDQEPDLAKLSIPQLNDLALWMQHYLRARLLVAEPDEVGTELAQLRGVPDVGATRILRAELFAHAGNEPLGVRGGGSHFSFVSKSHSYDDQPDLGLNHDHFGSGFYGNSRGYLLDLGDALLATLSAVPPATLAATDHDAYAHLWLAACDAKGNLTPEFVDRAATLKIDRSAPGLPAHTYVVRTILPNQHDVLAAFRSVGSDNTGHTIVWRILRRFGQFEPARSSMPKAPAGKAPSWIAAKSGEELLAALDHLRGIAEVRLLTVPEELVQTYGTEAKGELTGLCRILPRARFAALTKTRGEGAYYSFLTRSHDYNAKPQLVLEQERFSSGCAGSDRGLVVDLGDTPLATAELAAQHTDAWVRDAVTFLNGIAPERSPGGELVMRTQDQEAGRQRGYSQASAKPGHTYLLRSIQTSDDVLVVFRVLTYDAHGATLLWRIAQRR